MVIVAPLKSEDRPAREELSRGYKASYRTPTTDAHYEAAWRQLRDEGSGLCGLGAYLGGTAAGESAGTLVGITHYLFHPTMWYGDACYLQDLFVAEAARGRGAARALIERVAEVASEPRRYPAAIPPVISPESGLAEESAGFIGYALAVGRLVRKSVRPAK